MSIDQMAYCNAFKNVHPLEKGIFAGSFLFFSLLLKTPASAGFVFLLMGSAVVAGAKVPFVYYIKMLLLPFLFLVTSVVMILFSFAPATAAVFNPLFQMVIGNWQLYMSQGSAQQVSGLLLSVMAGVSCMYFFILTTPIQQIIWLLQKMKLPALFIELFALTYRFIFVLMNNGNRVWTAQMSRLGYTGLKHSFTSSAQLVLSMFIKSLKTAQETQRAMDSRGNSGAFFEVEIHQTYRRRNWIVIGLLVISYCLLTLL